MSDQPAALRRWHAVEGKVLRGLQKLVELMALQLGAGQA